MMKKTIYQCEFCKQYIEDISKLYYIGVKLHIKVMSSTFFPMLGRARSVLSNKKDNEPDYYSGEMCEECFDKLLKYMGVKRIKQKKKRRK